MRLAGCFLIVVLTGMAYPVNADGQMEFTPASFTKGNDSLRYRIKFPPIESDVNIYISCWAHIHEEGWVGRNWCLTGDEDESAFSYAIQEAIKVIGNMPTHRINPAKVNGSAKFVVMQFTVQFLSYGNARIINIFPNHRINTELYGEYYSAPQRIISQNVNRVSYSREAMTNPAAVPVETTCSDILDTRIAWFSMVIDKSGARKELSLLNKDIPAACNEFLMSSYSRHKDYIPAMHQNKPVDAGLIDIHFRINSTQVNRY